MGTVETHFFEQRLLDTEYLRRYRNLHERHLREGFGNRERCYLKILEKLQSVFEYRERDGRYFSRRLLNYGNDIRSCEAVITEVIVYAQYIPLVRDGAIQSLDRCENDYDLRIQRVGQPEVFLEVMCIMPEFPVSENGTYSVNSHRQTGGASIRQKLLTKMRRQNQMQKARENWAVIELNDVSIAGDFTVRASLSGGYKLTLGLDSKQVLARGYDWTDSIFDSPETRFLHGVIDFDLGFYDERRYIVNFPVHGDIDEREPRIP